MKFPVPGHSFLLIFCRPFFILACGFGVLLSPASAAPKTGLFGSHETMSRQMVAFKKWNSMLERSKTEEQSENQSAALSQENIDCVTSQSRNPLLRRKCQVTKWHSLLNSLEDRSPDQQITEINLYMNKAPYITDMRNWGVPDYWATLRQFFRKDGDCEDYAIAKYLSLKELGFDVDAMRIVVVQDTNLDVPHAVLVVSVGDTRLVLDNQISYVVKEKAVLHYKPLYSINENAWWLHRM
ncbi:transglutaminase-like cysteine peptidase [Paremcibacter congregatus]|uniref:transglutaminase-like cysteine peptidase n=1 Tax=Paremcibacter congregatus TaxID=2043170 RepID=UPI0030EEC986|tara:strand:+ start:6065 stop:6781 length:717 start_codon:yes stop_codon:yes gene_type:complete